MGEVRTWIQDAAAFLVRNSGVWSVPKSTMCGRGETSETSETSVPREGIEFDK